MNETTAKLINWIWSEPDLAEFLREIANGDEFEYGDTELGAWISDLLDNTHSQHADIVLANKGADLRAARKLRRELTEGRDRLEWLDEMDAELIRTALVGSDDGGPHIYVHATVKGFNPNNRYRVHSPDTVYEIGWTSASGAWGLAEPDRQVCPESIDQPCSCTVVQRDR
ncbi:hypothetical protein ACFW2V_13595 [Streptomyces sp. NPDC058947]|uniref:hypothetical protein n=1 Tax=Streptomyces sp. NPDC058947 TaxID=3346675 RepID=UPI0036C062F3